MFELDSFNIKPNFDQACSRTIHERPPHFAPLLTCHLNLTLIQGSCTVKCQKLTNLVELLSRQLRITCIIIRTINISFNIASIELTRTARPSALPSWRIGNYHVAASLECPSIWQFEHWILDFSACTISPVVVKPPTITNTGFRFIVEPPSTTVSCTSIQGRWLNWNCSSCLPLWLLINNPLDTQCPCLGQMSLQTHLTLIPQSSHSYQSRTLPLYFLAHLLQSLCNICKFQ